MSVPITRLQIPANRSQNLSRQNSKSCRFHVYHSKVRRGGRRFLCADLSIFCFRDRILPPGWNFGSLTFLISRFSIQTQGRPQPGDYKVLAFDFTIQNSGLKETRAHPQTVGSTFHISRVSEVSIEASFHDFAVPGKHMSHFLLLISQCTDCKEFSVYTLKVLRIRLQTES